MTIEVRAVGSACNIRCRYCYEDLERTADNPQPGPYDLEKIMETLEEINKSFSLFGGEALLMPEPDLDKLWKWGFEKFGENGIQTNGVLINDKHIEMFKKYKVHVGFSADGPGELNDLRWAGSLEKTRAATARTFAAMERVAGEGIRWSLIASLHRVNATAEKLPVMHEWFRKLDAMGLTKARLHFLQADSEAIRDKYSLTTEENIAAFLSFHELERELSNLKFDVFTDMRNLLLGQDEKSTCTYNACDPYSTRSFPGIEGDGQRSNCGRSDKDGLIVAKCETPGFERNMALYQVPQEYGGCQGCRFFLACKGECPGAAIDNDWRNRSRNCDVLKGLFEYIESELVRNGDNPLSLRDERRDLESALMEAWSAGENIKIAEAMEKLHAARKGCSTSKCAGSHEAGQ